MFLNVALQGVFLHAKLGCFTAAADPKGFAPCRRPPAIIFLALAVFCSRTNSCLEPLSCLDDHLLSDLWLVLSATWLGIRGLSSRIRGLGTQIRGLCCRISGLGAQIHGLGSRICGLGSLSCGLAGSLGSLARWLAGLLACRLAGTVAPWLAGLGHGAQGQDHRVSGG